MIENAKKRILLVDDAPIIRGGLAALIQRQEDLEVCGECGDAGEALKLIETNRPDLVIVEIAVSRLGGIELIKEIASRFAQVQVLVLSSCAELPYGERSLRAGARGYVMKSVSSTEILAAIRNVLAGQVHVSERVATQLLHRVTTTHSTAGMRSPTDPLSDRELQVFRCIGLGLAMREIAADLYLSVKTIESHVAHIKQKMNLRSSSELRRYAIQCRDLDGVLCE